MIVLEWTALDWTTEPITMHCTCPDKETVQYLYETMIQQNLLENVCVIVDGERMAIDSYFGEWRDR